MPSPIQVFHYPSWLTAGIGCVVALSFAAAFQAYRSDDAYVRASQDPYMINVQPERVREATALLPANAVIGYLSDLPFDGAAGQAAYFGVMYALAPRLLTRSADSAEWVMGNFSHPLDYAVFGDPHHLELVRDFRNGIVLFRRRAQ